MTKASRVDRYASDPEYREIIKQQSRESYRRNAAKRRAQKAGYRAANKEAVSDSKSRYYKANREKANAAKARWLKENPEKAKEHMTRTNNRRRARKLGATSALGVVSVKMMLSRKNLFAGCCYCKDASAPLTIEHFLPISAGGLHVEHNLLGACERCNKSKSARDPEQWFRAQPFFTERRWQEILKAVGKAKQHHGQLALL